MNIENKFPKTFYEGLNEDEFRALQQIYDMAYGKEKLKVENDNNFFDFVDSQNPKTAL